MIETLCLVYTKKCNARCRMCSASSGPEREEKMSLSLAKDCIDQARSISSIKSMTLTGGEPLLFFDEVREILSYAHAAGFSTKVITNAFWAETDNTALSRLRSLKESGLDVISLSTDSYHQEFVPLENIGHALRAAGELNIRREVAVIVGKRDRDRIMQQLGSLNIEEEFVPLSNFVGLEFSYSKDLIKNKIGLALMPLQGTGRGRQILEDSILRSPEEIAVLTCPTVGKILNVSPEGDVIWCCYTNEQEGRSKEFYGIGNLSTVSLKEMDKYVENDPLCEFIAFQGPANLLKDAVQFSAEALAREKFSCMCDMCCEAFKLAGRDTLRSLALRQTMTTKMMRKAVTQASKQMMPVIDNALEGQSRKSNE